MVTKPSQTASQIKVEAKSSPTPQPIPTLLRKALMQAGIFEEEIPLFLSWAFDGKFPPTFKELCLIWNEKFGSKLWVNVAQLNSAQECFDFFFRMGQVFTATRTS